MEGSFQLYSYFAENALGKTQNLTVANILSTAEIFTNYIKCWRKEKNREKKYSWWFDLIINILKSATRTCSLGFCSKKPLTLVVVFCEYQIYMLINHSFHNKRMARVNFWLATISNTQNCFYLSIKYFFLKITIHSLVVCMVKSMNLIL